MRIAIGSDHAGFLYKQALVEHLKASGHQVLDVGTHSLESTDYPLYAFKVAEAIQLGHADEGILICGTGIGMSIAANKVKGIRAGAAQSLFAAQAIKEHNDANILCVGSRINTLQEVQSFTDVYLKSHFQGGERHSRRIDLISKYEGGK